MSVHYNVYPNTPGNLLTDKDHFCVIFRRNPTTHQRVPFNHLFLFNMDTMRWEYTENGEESYVDDADVVEYVPIYDPMNAGLMLYTSAAPAFDPDKLLDMAYSSMRIANGYELEGLRTYWVGYLRGMYEAGAISDLRYQNMRRMVNSHYLTLRPRPVSDPPTSTNVLTTAETLLDDKEITS